MAQGGCSPVIFDEYYYENYEPEQSEVIEYGRYLGMDPEKDAQFLWIAREGLKAPLPEHWKAVQTEDQDIYYFNFKTRESIWDHPCDKYYRNLFQEEKKKALQKPPKPQEENSEHYSAPPTSTPPTIMRTKSLSVLPLTPKYQPTSTSPGKTPTSPTTSHDQAKVVDVEQKYRTLIQQEINKHQSLLNNSTDNKKPEPRKAAADALLGADRYILIRDTESVIVDSTPTKKNGSEDKNMRVEKGGAQGVVGVTEKDRKFETQGEVHEKSRQLERRENDVRAQEKVGKKGDGITTEMESECEIGGNKERERMELTQKEELEREMQEKMVVWRAEIETRKMRELERLMSDEVLQIDYPLRAGAVHQRGTDEESNKKLETRKWKESDRKNSPKLENEEKEQNPAQEKQKQTPIESMRVTVQKEAEAGTKKHMEYMEAQIERLQILQQQQMEASDLSQVSTKKFQEENDQRSEATENPPVLRSSSQQNEGKLPIQSALMDDLHPTGDALETELLTDHVASKEITTEDLVKEGENRLYHAHAAIGTEIKKLKDEVKKVEESSTDEPNSAPIRPTSEGSDTNGGTSPAYLNVLSEVRTRVQLEQDRLRQVRQFLREQTKDLRVRKSQLEREIGSTESTSRPVTASQRDRISRINEEVLRLNQTKLFIKENEEKLKGMDSQLRSSLQSLPSNNSRVSPPRSVSSRTSTTSSSSYNTNSRSEYNLKAALQDIEKEISGVLSIIRVNNNNNSTASSSNNGGSVRSTASDLMWPFTTLSERETDSGRKSPKSRDMEKRTPSTSRGHLKQAKENHHPFPQSHNYVPPTTYTNYNNHSTNSHRHPTSQATRTTPYTFPYPLPSSALTRWVGERTAASEALLQHGHWLRTIRNLVDTELSKTPQSQSGGVHLYHQKDIVNHRVPVVNAADHHRPVAEGTRNDFLLTLDRGQSCTIHITSN